VPENFQWGLKRVRKTNRREASKRGLLVIEPRSNELQIDIDGARAMRHYSKQYAILERGGQTRGWKETLKPSHTKGHAHITIRLPRSITDLKRVCLQAILGSDPSREAFNYVRVQNRNRYPIVFFEKKSVFAIENETR